MPNPYLLTPRAIDDLDEIWNYIAQDSPAAADRVESSIFEAFSSLARHPMLGSKRTEISSLPVRFWVLGRYPSTSWSTVRIRSRFGSSPYFTQNGI